MKKSLLLGIIGSFFFAFTFILNSSMNLSGGSFIWSASLRYIFMLPLLYMFIWRKKDIMKIIAEMIARPFSWIIWSTIGFGIFYFGITFAAVWGPSWLVASTWQITIIAGALLSPLFFTGGIRNKIPVRFICFSFIILIGVVFMQIEQAEQVRMKQFVLGVIPVVIAAFAYPLGNRKMMELCDGRLTTLQRVFGMTLASMPFWLILSIYEITHKGLPSVNQTLQSVIVALFSGVLGTVLFFKATEICKNHPSKLAIIESTQAGEIVFTLLGELFLLQGYMPSLLGWLGMVLVIIGMILTSFLGMKRSPSNEITVLNYEGS